MAESIPTSSNVEAEKTVNTLLSRVTSALADQEHEQVFTIGGKLDAVDSHVTLRWNAKSGDDTGNKPAGDKITFPVPKDSEGFQRLLKDCEPATFGLGQRDVLDETYRKAGKMDTTEFCTNFTPYEHGIIDAVVQALAQSRQIEGQQSRGVKAELYKLNIYSAPSGKFKSHVDTPRSDRQMGSLVVCLPCVHKGGELAVRHAGRETIFDWSSTSASSVQWAAFFSNCEHEVLDVTEGHRVTLTYNLYWVPFGPASMADSLKSIDETSLHFFTAVKDLLACPDFLPDGGVVGFACGYAYPHNSTSSKGHLPSTLKGLDMAVYQVLSRLMGAARVAVYLHDEYYHEQLREWYEEYSEGSERVGPRRPKLIANPGATLGRPGYEPIQWGYNCEDLQDPVNFKPSGRRTGEWIEGPGYERQHVTWLNRCPDSETHKELAVAYLTYGNSPSIEAYYSSAVLVAQVEPADKRSRERGG